VLTTVDAFYLDVLGNLRAWSAAPPKLRSVSVEPADIDDTVPAALVSTDYSSQDGTTEEFDRSDSDGTSSDLPDTSRAVAVVGHAD
jgi:hypothetical protein